MFFGLDYYPYGKILREFNPEAEKYLSTHHERDTETGLDYRGARYYDADVARFLSLDPKAMEYASLSDYNYVAGNPIFYIDPEGTTIKVHGDALISKFKKVLAAAFNDRLAVTVVDGVLGISHKEGAEPFSTNEMSAYLELKLVILNQDETVTFNLTDHSENVSKEFTVDSYNTGGVDLDDIAAFGNDDNGLTSKGKFVHIAKEQLGREEDMKKGISSDINKGTKEERAVARKAYLINHNKGIDGENGANTYQRAKYNVNTGKLDGTDKLGDQNMKFNIKKVNRNITKNGVTYEKVD
ncbi:MAG: hypothetical protein COB15_11740 [Flavobacteriales bacterium]|nr:MAG: hypothetical protein COB15_11740 [Flavobacteriales bacterium]